MAVRISLYFDRPNNKTSDSLWDRDGNGSISDSHDFWKSKIEKNISRISSNASK